MCYVALVIKFVFVRHDFQALNFQAEQQRIVEDLQQKIAKSEAELAESREQSTRAKEQLEARENHLTEAHASLATLQAELEIARDELVQQKSKEAAAVEPDPKLVCVLLYGTSRCFYLFVAKVKEIG